MARSYSELRNVVLAEFDVALEEAKIEDRSSPSYARTVGSLRDLAATLQILEDLATRRPHTRTRRAEPL